MLQNCKFCFYFATECQSENQISSHQGRVILDSLVLCWWLWRVVTRSRRKCAGDEWIQGVKSWSPWKEEPCV